MRWFSMGTQTFNDPKVVKLGERHGPLGLAVWTALLCNAGAQEEGGEISLTFRGLAHEVFDTPEEVATVVDSVAEVGLMRLDSRDATAFDAVIPAWKRWGANARQAKSRDAKKGLEKADVTDQSRDSHGESRVVTTDRQTDKETNREPRTREIPSEFHPAFQAVEKVTDSRALSFPETTSLLDALRCQPDCDLTAEVERFAAFYTDGKGQRARITSDGHLIERLTSWLTEASPKLTIKRAPLSPDLDPDNVYDDQVRVIEV